MSKIFIIFTLILTLCKVYCDTTTIKYFPLKTGNLYIYDVHISGSSGNRDTVIKSYILSDSIMGNRHYYILKDFPKFNNNKLYRCDTVTGSIMYFNIQNSCQYYHNETFLDSLSANQGNNIFFCGSPLSNSTYKCTLDSVFNIFGIETKQKVFYYSYFIGSYGGNYSIQFVKYFGICSYFESSYGGMSGSSKAYSLKGCVINGVVYGDTSSIIGIVTVSTMIPAKYSLSQNYPNPFNPQTNIKFDIPNRSYVKISVYDILGKEISILVSEELNPGTFEVNWDASNFPSGVYFYKLFTDDFSESKKMVLVK